VICSGSNRRVVTSPGQRFTTAGFVRPNRAQNVRCPECGRVFRSARIVHTDHGIPTPPMALVPRHKES